MCKIYTTITKKDLIDSSYLSTGNCALAKTLKRVIKEGVSVGGYSVDIGNSRYYLSSNLDDLLVDMCANNRDPKDTPIVIDTINHTISIDK